MPSSIQEENKVASLAEAWKEWMTESRTSAVAGAEKEEVGELRVPGRRTPNKKLQPRRAKWQSHPEQIWKTNL